MPKTPTKHNENTKLPTYIMMTGDIFSITSITPTFSFRSLSHTKIGRCLSLSLARTHALCLHSIAVVFFPSFTLSHLVVIFYYTFTERRAENECVFYAVYACCCCCCFFYNYDKLILTNDNHKSEKTTTTTTTHK